MKFRLYREHGALNSPPIFDAVEQGIRCLGHEISQDDDTIPIIWSVLWHGRMAKNRIVYEQAVNRRMPVIIIEVGNLIRNKSWRISVNNINGLGYFANAQDIDPKRPEKLGVHLKDLKLKRRPEILIATQLPQSLQWSNMPTMSDWVKQTVRQIRKYSNRKIIVRPHPRGVFKLDDASIEIQMPQKKPGTYDDFDIDYSYHCVINHNSGPAVQAAIDGTPIICDQSSLAAELTGNFSEIENISLPDRNEWFKKLCHTEWTVDEIRSGIPFDRLLKSLDY
jgi:hypothetical protein